MDSGLPDLHAFCAGLVAIQQLWPGNISNCESHAPAVFEDIAVGPPLEGPQARAMHPFVSKYMLPWKLTKHPDAVFETLKYFASPMVNYKINLVGDRGMPHQQALEGIGFYQFQPWRDFANNFSYALPRQVTKFTDVRPAMSRWIEKAALDESSVSETLRGMDEEVQEILDG